MKKSRLLLLLPFLVLMVACGKSAKDTFISHFESADSNKNMAYQLTTTITDITSDDKDLKQLVNKSFTTTVNRSSKTKKADVKINLSQLGNNLPNYEFIAIKNDLYMNLDALVQLQNFNSSSSQITFDSKDFAGKYINANDISDEKFAFDYSKKEDIAWLKKLSADDFTKSNKTSTLTLTSDNIAKLLSNIVGKQTYTKQVRELLSDESTIRIKLDENGHANATAHLVFKDSKTFGLSAIKLKIASQKVNYTEPKAPEAQNVLSTTQLTSLMAENYKYSNADFEEFYNTIKETAGDFSAAQLQSTFSEEMKHMTDSQLAKFKDMINQNARN